MQTRESHGISVGRLLAALMIACLAVSCGGKQPESPVSSTTAPTMPGDHPPVADAGPPLPRLAAGTVLAMVGDEMITAGDVDATIGAMPGADRLEYTSPEMVRDLVESLVDRKLMAAAARAEGADRDSPEQVLAAAWLAGQLAGVPVPAEADVAAYYREHGNEFRVPARVLVTRVTAATAAVAERLRRELARGATAGELGAGPAGEVLSASQLWLQDVEKAPEATAIALALKPGEVSRTVPVPDGFLVMRADRVEPAGPRPLAEVSAGIRASLEDARRQAAVAALRDRLRSSAAISVDEAVLMSYRPPAQGLP
ncbi:MAG: peptidyl-prolyl cis-trans isomerase [Chromatiales bacterium]|nr:peptidyl-prolyl cis-trans isomerase [Chromatiales bacterium]